MSTVQEQVQITAEERAELARLRADNAALKAANEKAHVTAKPRHSLGNNLTCRISEGGILNPKTGKTSTGGGLSIYGLNKAFPVTLKADQWERLFASVDAIKAFIAANNSAFVRKPVEPKK